MTETQKQAQEYATKIQWDTQKSFEFAYAILTECNLHAEAKTLKEKYEENNK